MRSICSIILLISIITSLADDKVPNATIWYDGITFYKSFNKKKNTTLFFSEWESSIYQFVNDKNYKIVLQLDSRMDPLPADELILPNINYLSAIEDDSLVAEYFYFLENYSRTLGYSHLVLPDTLGLSVFEKEVIESANKASPFFFISNSNVSPIFQKQKKI